MADIAAALAEVDTGRGEFLPTVAISGRGGVGKSCLAIQAAHLLRDRFPDGNLYASLRPSGEDDVLSRFLRALGVPAGDIPAQRQDKVELYRALLIGRRVLVVLEDADCEEQVLPLVPGLPGCAAIVTSRWRLGALPGTRWIHLSELDIADSLAFMAKQLGDERVTLERPAAAELAARCAGLPLALRIATARLVARPHLRIAEFVDRLGDEATQLDELSHRGLDVRASIAASYERLSAEGKRLLRRLSVIRAADFPAAVGAMLLGTDADHGRLVMDMLADADLLTATRSTCDDSVRYRFAGLVRSYAREQLAASETPEEYERLVEQWDHDVPDVVLGEVGPESEHHGDRDSTAQLSLWL
jgi:predicted ATPase